MSISKGIVQGGNYTFSAANQTITFSSDYLGMSLSDITYITNIKSGVATVIYDPFDVAKGGVLTGLTLTLAYNTTLMSNSDPLQIIVGFTSPNPAPINVNIQENLQLDTQTDLLQNISDNLDFLNLSLDQSEGIQVNTRDANPAKRDFNNAQVPSDCITFTKTLRTFSDVLLIETTGYNSIEVTFNGDVALTSAQISPASSVDGVNWLTLPSVNNSSTTTAAVANIGVSSSSSVRALFPVIGKFIRFTLIGISGGGTVTIVANLRQTQLITGPFTQIPVNASINIGGNTPSGIATVANNPTSPTTLSGALNFTGSAIATSNPPNAFSTLATTIPYPLGIAGREQPYIGNLSGLLRYITVDGGGRYILGGDTPDTETRTQSKRADGSIPGIPPRGVGARPNTMFGSQSLLVEDTSQAEGDTIPTLLQQILVELKMLNSQINEIPFIMNLGVKMQNEVGEYRTEEYNNHVNNQ